MPQINSVAESFLADSPKSSQGKDQGGNDKLQKKKSIRSKFAEQAEKKRMSEAAGEDVSGPEDEETKLLIKKRDTHKIKTNLKYKCLDEGSDEGDEGKQEDYQQLSSKEIDFRETIIKLESKVARIDLYRKETQEGAQDQGEGD